MVTAPTAKGSNPVQITTALGATLCFCNTNNAGGYGGNTSGMYARTPGSQSIFQPAVNGGRTVICGYYNLWAAGFTRWNATIGTISDFASAGPTKNIFGFDMNGSNQASVGIGGSGGIGGAASGVSGMGTVGTYHTVGVSYVQTDGTHSSTIIQPDTASSTSTSNIVQVPAGMEMFAIGSNQSNTSAMEPVLWTAVLNIQLTAAQMLNYTKFKGDIPPGLLIRRRPGRPW
jgi:hypothetical protein